MSICIYFDTEAFEKILWMSYKWSKHSEDDVCTLRLNKTVLLPKVVPFCVLPFEVFPDPSKSFGQVKVDWLSAPVYLEQWAA